MSRNAEFEEMAVPLFEPLYNFACWLAQDRAEAEDLVQESYTKALKGFGSFQRGTNFKAWIFQILRNTFLTSKTGLAAKLTVPLEHEEEGPSYEPVETTTPETILLANSSKEAVQKAIEQLPIAYREVLLLADLEEFKYAEIAEALRVPIGTVMSRLSRARKAVRASLSKTESRVTSRGSKGADHAV
jgi:RNA polymerase sigma-70 factor (ECF subfamily)